MIALCTKAIQKDPKSARAFFNRGWAYRMRGEWEKAIADFTRAIELDPKLLAAYYKLARGFRAAAKSRNPKRTLNGRTALLRSRDSREAPALRTGAAARATGSVEGKGSATGGGA